MLDSALSLAARPSEIALQVLLDADDPELANYDTTGCQVTMMPERSNSVIGHRTLIEAATADYLVLTSDDMVYRTQDWDEMVLEAFEQIPDDLGIVSFNSGRKFPEGIAVSKKWTEFAKPFFFPEFEHFYVDAIFLEIAAVLERLFSVDNIRIDHLHYKYKTGPKDEPYRYKRMNGMGARDKDRYIAAQPRVSEMIHRLRRELNSYERKAA